MANEMKVHLFQVHTLEGESRLEDLLEAISIHPLDQRVRTIGHQDIRLEYIAPPRSRSNPSPYWLMDFTRMRFENGPGKISRDDPIEAFDLGDEDGFGEETAVLFDPVTQHMLIQYNHNGARAGKIEEYLCCYDGAIVGKYSLHVVLDRSATARLSQKAIINKLHFKVAPPRITASQRNNNVSLQRAVELADNLDGETVEVIISARNGRLNMGRVQSAIRSLTRMVPDGDDFDNGALRTFKVSGKNHVNDVSDEINMLLSKEEVTIDGLQLGQGLRFTQASRWDGLLRARRGWNSIL